MSLFAALSVQSLRTRVDLDAIARCALTDIANNMCRWTCSDGRKGTFIGEVPQWVPASQ